MALISHVGEGDTVEKTVNVVVPQLFPSFDSGRELVTSAHNLTVYCEPLIAEDGTGQELVAVTACWPFAAMLETAMALPTIP